MENAEINNYIKKRYPRWLDYAEYHTSQAGLQGESIDLLNEVLLSLLKKNEDSILKLLHSKNGQYCELDFYVLRSIKMNATSETAPYRFKNRNRMPIDVNVDFSRIEIEDIIESEIDKSHEILEKHKTICKIVDRFDLNKIEKEVFHHAFILQEPISSHDKCDNLRKQLYASYSTIKIALSVILFQEGNIQTHLKTKITGRAKNLVDKYNLTKMY
jgi:hypothetical protein